jgi:hypothetical protein
MVDLPSSPLAAFDPQFEKMALEPGVGTHLYAVSNETTPARL